MVGFSPVAVVQPRRRPHSPRERQAATGSLPPPGPVLLVVGSSGGSWVFAVVQEKWTELRVYPSVASFWGKFRDTYFESPLPAVYVFPPFLGSLPFDAKLFFLFTFYEVLIFLLIRVSFLKESFS